MAQASPSTVALIAHGIIERKIKFRELDESDFSGFIVPGTTMSYGERTRLDACREAWDLVKAAEIVMQANP